MNNTGGRASSFPSSSSSFSPPLSKLKLLHLWKIQELESLPEEWFKNLTSLENLQILGCPDVTSLPEGMSHLTSLQRVEIENCPNLRSLPEWMSHLTSLQTLKIGNCPKLKQRCEKENGEDWDKISHIPNLYISWTTAYASLVCSSLFSDFFFKKKNLFYNFYNSRRKIFKAQAKPKLKNSIISFSTHKIKKQNFTFYFSPVSFSSPRNSLVFWMCDWCSNCRKNKRISNGKIGKKKKA